MINRVLSGYKRWKDHPRRYDLAFLVGTPWRRLRAARHNDSVRQRLLDPPIDITNVEILHSTEFRASCAAVREHTLLDVARLANLWSIARMAGAGSILEVGTYRGGGALHICNALRDRNPQFFCFDPFEDGGFENIGHDDDLFQQDHFKDTRYDKVVKLLAVHRNASVVKGFFPAAAQGLDLSNIAFCHLDVDVYGATKDSLEFLSQRLAPRSFIILDDYNRKVAGVKRAVEEFLETHPGFMVVPLFPSQGLLFSTDLWTRTNSPEEGEVVRTTFEPEERASSSTTARTGQW